MKKKGIKIITAILILIIVACAAYLIYYYYTSYRAESNFDKLRDMVIEMPTIEYEEDSTANSNTPKMVTIDGIMVQEKFEKLYRGNRDFVGWIKIDDTLVDYPVMHTPNDNERGEYYIHRDYDQEYSAAGLPFIDKHCMPEVPTDNVIIYGHNMNSGTMFHDIIRYEDESFFEEHRTFSFDTIYEDGTYEVIAAFYGEILADDSEAFKYYEFVNANDEEEFMGFVENVKAMSIYDTGVEVSYGDKLITLSTCAYHVEDGRFAVVAKKIQ